MSECYQHICQYPELFKALTSLSIAEFDLLVEVLIGNPTVANDLQTTADDALTQRDQLLCTITWYCQHPTLGALGALFGCDKERIKRYLARWRQPLLEAGLDPSRQPGPQGGRSLSTLCQALPELRRLVEAAPTTQVVHQGSPTDSGRHRRRATDGHGTTAPAASREPAAGSRPVATRGARRDSQPAATREARRGHRPAAKGQPAGEGRRSVAQPAPARSTPVAVPAARAGESRRAVAQTLPPQGTPVAAPAPRVDKATLETPLPRWVWRLDPPAWTRLKQLMILVLVVEIVVALLQFNAWFGLMPTTAQGGLAVAEAVGGAGPSAARALSAATSLPPQVAAATPPVPVGAPVTGSLVSQVIMIEEGLRSGSFEALLEIGGVRQSATRLLVDRGNQLEPGRLQIMTVVPGGEQSREQIAIGGQWWERTGTGPWQVRRSTEEIQAYLHSYLPNLASATQIEVERAVATATLRWYDTSQDADVVLTIDLATGTPRQLRRATRTTQTLLTVTYLNWNEPVVIRAP